MKNDKWVFGCAFLTSVILHGLIAGGIALHAKGRPALVAPVRLELAQVSLAASNPVADHSEKMTSVAVSKSEPPKPACEAPTTECIPSAEPIMAEPDTTNLPKPQEPRIELKAPATAEHAHIDAPPKPEQAIRPDYPRDARRRGEQGDVTLEIDVNAAGGVDTVRVYASSGYPLLDQAAVTAAQKARFFAARSGSVPVASTVRLTLNFRLK